MSDEPVAAWVRHQGLSDRTGLPLHDVVARTGWIRTLGGVDAYLALHARAEGVTAAAVHAAVATGALRVSPAARGCIYLVPRAHAPLALGLARDLTASRASREATKAGIRDGELAAVGEAIVARLAAEPTTTTGLRRALPDGVIRSLGDAGKKVGITSTLPPALRELEFAGRIRRRVVDDRLDHERYVWVLTEDTTVDTRPEATRHAELAALFLQWFAPARPEALADFSGLNKTRSRRAFASSGALEQTDGTWVLPHQRDTLDAPAPDRTVLLPGLDNLLVWHGGPRPFVHPDDLSRTLSPWGRQKGRTWGEVKHALTRVVLSEGVVRGIWEWDAEEQEVVLGSYAPGLPEDASEEAARVAELLRALGHGRAFSIDKDSAVADRCADVRALSGDGDG